MMCRVMMRHRDAPSARPASTYGRERTEDVSTPLRAWTSQPWHVAQESVLNTQRHWVESLRRGVEPEVSGADNLKTYALVEAAYESALRKTAVGPFSYAD